MKLFQEGDHVVFREDGKDPPVCGVVKGYVEGIETEYIVEIPHINNTGRDCITAREDEMTRPRTRLKVAQKFELEKEKKE